MKWFLFSALLLSVSFMIFADEAEEEFRINSTAMLNVFEDEMGMLTEVQLRLRRGRYREGIELLQMVMERAFKDKEAAGKLFHRSENVYIPVDEYCFQLLKGLPFEGYDLYLTLYSATAENLLKRALSEGDIKTVELVSRLYPLTDSARKALLILADCALEEGNGAKALQYLRRAERLVQRRTTTMALKTVAAMLLQDMEESARELLLSLREEGLNEREKWIKRILLQQIKPTSTPKRRSDIYNSFYDSLSAYRVPDDIESLSKATSFDWEFELRRREQVRRTSGGGTISTETNQFPLVIGDIVYSVDTRRICALRANGGKLLWRYPRSPSPPVNEISPLAIETDGKTLFCVLGSTRSLKKTAHQRGRVVVVRGRLVRGGITSNNDLYAFDITRRRSLLWSAKDLNPGIDSVVFITPPRLAGEHILIGGVDVSGKDKIYLLCCFSKEGELLWKRRILSVTQQTYIYSGVVECMDGEALFLTNNGVLASVSIHTGTILWAVLYPVARVSDQPARRRVTASPYNPHPVPPILWKGVYKGRLRRAVLIAPSDSKFIMAYDMDARRLLWLEGKEGHSYFFKLRKNLVLASGGHSKIDASKKAVTAYHIFTGKIRLHFETDRLVVAKGLVSGDDVLLPCSKGLLHIRLRPSESSNYFIGKQVGFYRWFSPSEGDKQSRSRVLKGCGNLILLKNRLITGYGRWLHSFEFGQ